MFLVPPVFPAGSSRSCTRAGLSHPLLLLFHVFYLCPNCLCFPCVLPSAPALPLGPPASFPVKDRECLCSARGGAECWHPVEPCWESSAGPGYLISATLYWYLEICFCCQEIYNCNRPNISRKQTKSCWFCLYCYLFTDWKCQEQSLTMRNSMPVLQIIGSWIIFCIQFCHVEFSGLFFFFLCPEVSKWKNVGL